jgi:hypothetical protein
VVQDTQSRTGYQFVDGYGGRRHFSTKVRAKPSQKRGKLTFKGKIDPRLIPTDSAPGFEIADVQITESAVEVWLSDGRIIITPVSWYPTLEAATPKQRRGFENLGVGLAWDELDLHLSVEGMLAGKREFRRRLTLSLNGQS